jgi:hypothetical protein
MRGYYLTAIASVALGMAAQGNARTALALIDATGGAPQPPAPGVLQCVPFARVTSGIRLYGDAHTWWRQAAGKYARGQVPRVGAVMALSPHGGSTLGHVATVSRIIDSRTILISHANWSAPGKVERNVKATDVSPANDWSEVRVWYAPIASLGGGHWPVTGFIYNARPGLIDRASPAGKSGTAPRSSTITRIVPGKTVKVRFGEAPELAVRTPSRGTPLRAPAAKALPRPALAHFAKSKARRDPIGAIIALAR